MDGNDPSKAAPASGSEAVVIKARSGGRRKSCNRCSRKKERCDGKEPCKRCTRSGLECRYDACRTLGRPRNPPGPPKRSAKSAEGAAKTVAVGATSASVGAQMASVSGGVGVNSVGSSVTTGCREGGAHRGVTVPYSREFPVQMNKVSGHGAGAVDDSAPAAVTAKPRQKPVRRHTPKSKEAEGMGGRAVASVSSTLKQPILSPSPATGLTGLVQNKYLTCFVDDFASFFSVLDEVTIRAGLINLMTGKVDPLQLAEASDVVPAPLLKKHRSDYCASSSPSGRASGMDDAGGEHKKTQTMTAAALDAAAATGDEQKRVVNAMNSSIFSAMSLGAMLLGQPPSHVHLYVTVAEASLRLCGVAGKVVAVPNEHVAAAALLLAFAANVSGKAEYSLHISVARQCYEARVRHGLQTPVPIRKSLGYRALIDGLGKPPDKKGLRIPLPPREMRIHPPEPVGVVDRDGDIGSSSESGGGSSMEGPGPDGGGLESLPSASAAGGNAKTGGGGGGAASTNPIHKAVQGGNAVRPLPRPGLEAARARRRLRQAEPMSMVSDIMTMLSRVPWTAHIQSEALRTKQNLLELRSLMIAEKALLEERRMVRGQDTVRSDGIAIFALAAAMIGLCLALDEFSELLSLARELASRVHACPGLARYQPHGYHASLVILAAFGKRSEFEALLGAVPTELRFSTSGSLLTYHDHSDTCSHPVCRKHAKAIVEMARNFGGGVEETASTSCVERHSTTSEEKAGGKGGGGDPSPGKSEAQSIATAVGENHLLPPHDGSALAPSPQEPPKGDRIATPISEALSPPVSTLPRPQDKRQHPLLQGSSLSMAVSAYRHPRPTVASRHGAASVRDQTAGAGGLTAGKGDRDAGKAVMEQGGHQDMVKSFPPSWSSVVSASDGLPPSNGGTKSTPPAAFSPVMPFVGVYGMGPMQGSNKDPPPRPPQTIGCTQGMNVGVLPPTAAVMTGRPSFPASHGLSRIRLAAGGNGAGLRKSKGPSASNYSRGLEGLGVGQSRATAATTSTATYGMTGLGAGSAAGAGASRGNGGGSLLLPQASHTNYGAVGSTVSSSTAESVGSTRLYGRCHAPEQPQGPLGMVEVGGGIRSIREAAKAGGTLTSRLWGGSNLLRTSPPGVSPCPGGGAGQLAPHNSSSSSSSSNDTRVSHPWRFHPAVDTQVQAPTTAAAATAVMAVSASPVIPASSASATPSVKLPRQLPSQQELATPGVAVGTTGQSSAPLLPLSPGLGVGTGHPAARMTAGEASAAAISRGATLKGTFDASSTSASVVDDGYRSGTGGVVEKRGGIVIQNNDECVDGVSVGPNDEEMMDLWEIMRGEE